MQDFEIIDKTHAEIKSYRNGGDKKFISFGIENTIFISNGAVVQFGLSKYRCIHFIIQKGCLYFYCDNDILTGFSLSKAKVKQQTTAALKVTSKSLMVSLQKRFQIKEKDKYFLIETTMVHDGKFLIKVLLDNPIKKGK